MKIFKKIIFLLLIVSLPLIFIHCTKYEEEAPFFDNLFLKYNAGGIRMIYNIQELDNSKFQIIETEKREPLNDKVEKMFVDKYGKVYKSSIKDYEGGFSPIWIPSDKIEIGDDLFNGDYTVIREDKWKEWNVLVLKANLVEEERYFDLNTGYFVGAKGKFGMSYEIVLVDTNADIPTAEE